MCAVSGLRSLLCEVVFRPAGPKLRVAGRRQGAGPDAGCKGEAGLALMQWLSSPVDGAESCSLHTLQLLTELLEVRNLHLFRSGVSVCMRPRLTVSIPSGKPLTSVFDAFRRCWDERAYLNLC